VLDVVERREARIVDGPPANSACRPRPTPPQLPDRWKSVYQVASTRRSPFQSNGTRAPLPTRHTLAGRLGRGAASVPQHVRPWMSHDIRSDSDTEGTMTQSNIVVATFDEESKTYQAFSEIKQRARSARSRSSRWRSSAAPPTARCRRPSSPADAASTFKGGLIGSLSASSGAAGVAARLGHRRDDRLDPDANELRSDYSCCGALGGNEPRQRALMGEIENRATRRERHRPPSRRRGAGRPVDEIRGRSRGRQGARCGRARGAAGDERAPRGLRTKRKREKSAGRRWRPSRISPVLNNDTTLSTGVRTVTAAHSRCRDVRPRAGMWISRRHCG